jgi:heme a synthase
LNIDKYRRAVGLWLMSMTAMVFAMILIGGLTRLTQSGLSMVEWKPLMGILPPLNEGGWNAVFDKYKAYPEYQKINIGMTLSEFKKIFWFEYGHRLLGRTIGIAFAFPFGFFLWKKAISRDLFPKLFILFCLGGAQGIIGWWMVKSGLIDRPDVSHYRLTIHLGLAVLLYIALLWVALGQFRSKIAIVNSAMLVRSKWAMVLLFMVYGTLLSGGIVAGLNAGSQFNTFPMMNGHFIPDGLFIQSPWYKNLTENLMTVQFNHRYFALTTALAIFIFWWWAQKVALNRKQKWALMAMMFAVLVQVSLGIITLLTVVWLPVASAHQMGAIILLTALVWVNHEFWRPSDRVLES